MTVYKLRDTSILKGGAGSENPLFERVSGAQK